MHIVQVKESFMRHFSAAGYQPAESAPLVIPELSTTFVLSVGLLQLKAVLTPHAEVAYFENFCMVQRCLRQFDIPNSGYANHLSFFEMAGAISSGDRSQIEVIRSVLDYLTEVIGLDRSRLLFTVFGGGAFMGRKMPADDNSQKSLVSLGITRSQIYPCGPDSNFFGNTERDVAYGPSLEIYLDRGLQASCPNRVDCRPGCVCQRYVEVGTCVFLKYLRDNGGFQEMPRAFCEAGIGVERVAFASSGLSSIYELAPLRDVAEFMVTRGLLNKGLQPKHPYPEHICSDYLRAVIFAIADGATPGGSGGRQHVMRTLIRRLLARLAWDDDAFIDTFPALVDLVVQRNMHIRAIPENMRTSVCEIITSETKLFRTNAESGKINPDRYLKGPEM